MVLQIAWKGKIHHGLVCEFPIKLLNIKFLCLNEAFQNISFTLSYYRKEMQRVIRLNFFFINGIIIFLFDLIIECEWYLVYIWNMERIEGSRSLTCLIILLHIHLAALEGLIKTNEDSPWHNWGSGSN